MIARSQPQIRKSDGERIAGPCKLTLTVARDKDNIIVSVSDTGMGIEPDLLTKVFEAGVSTVEYGKGIGLVTSKEIIEAHGGTINISSELGKGTTVHFTLPI
jgi:signal transduction histidine kinase